MINGIIEFSLRNRLLVAMVTLLIALAGVWATFTTPVDAIPDLSDVQVIVYTDYPGQSPQLVEDQITYPLSTAMLSVPLAKSVRGFSMFGYSMIYVIFEDKTDLYWARSRVLESLNSIQQRLPQGVSPRLGPDATGVGWVYIYSLTSDRHDLSELRSIQDWYLKYELTAIEGVSEVASAGGFVRQYQIEVDPEKLRAFGVSLSEVNNAIKRSNSDVGGRLLEMGETEFMVRGKGYIGSIDDFEQVPIGIDNSTHSPLLLKQVAHIHKGPDIRRGVMEMDGEGEVVSGIVVMRSGDNALETIRRVKKRLNELKEGLPDGVEIHTSYDRSELILEAVNTLKEKLSSELLIVALVTIAFLLHFRSAFVALITVPVGVLISILVMRLLDINANIMSLGGIAIAIGVMLDASVVMVENLHKHKEREPDKSQLELVLAASKEVGPALFFSLLIVTISFLPVFTLEQQEGRMFSPLAYTKTFSMAASSILAVTIIPILMYYFVRGRIISENKNPISRILIWCYRPILNLALKFPLVVVVGSIAIAAYSYVPLSKLGSEFMPPLNEGDLLYMPTTLPGISITKAKELLQQTDKIIKSHPQVEHVLGKVGRADTATDPAPLSMLETHIILKPQKQWPEGKTIEDVISELDNMVQFPGVTNAWTMPIKTRIDMLATGIKTPVGIKLLGADLEKLSALGQEIESVLREDKDVQSVYSERVTGGKYIDITVKRADAARFGLTVADVQDVIKTAIGGMNIGETIEGLERYPINVRYPRELRNNMEELRRLAVPTRMGHSVPLANVADIEIKSGPAGIKSENSRRTAWVFVTLNTADIGGFIEKAKKIVSEKVELPTGVSLLWSGQYEYMERAKKKLTLVVPMIVAIIFMLLFIHFKNVTETLIVMLSLPFALVGGIWLMYWSGYNLSVAVAVGFIALAGLAIETGVVMLVYLDESLQRWKKGKIKTPQTLKNAVIEGAVDRVRPKLMTVSTTLFALLPIMFGTEVGTRIMKRIAAPMIGGLVSSTILTLIVLPVVYLLWVKIKEKDEFNNKENRHES